MTSSVDPTRLVGGRYVLEKLIGEGGTGEVWRARHVTLHSPVAIKLLHGSAAFRESTRKRFLTEARVAAQLSTRHAVKVFDFGVTEQGRPYLIMELLDGETLATRLERQKVLTPFTTARVLRLASRALDAAHALGVVHRDFKPENIFLVRTEEEEEDVKVVDFGVAKLVGELGNPDDEDAEPLSVRRLEKSFMSFTRSGKSVGTPVYMAPEQTTANKDVGPAADVWAVGVVAYECLTGYRPFTARNLETLFDRIRSCKYVAAVERNPALPEAFDDWFRTTCNPDPARRFPNASAATMRLIEVLGIQPSTITQGDPEVSYSLQPSVRSPSSPPSDASYSRRSQTSTTTSAPAATVTRTTRKPRHAAILALVATSVLIALGIGWQLRPMTVVPVATSEPEPPPPVTVAEAPSVSASSAASNPATDGTGSEPAGQSATPPRGAERRMPAATTEREDRDVTNADPTSPQPPAPTKSSRRADPTPPVSPFELPELGL